MRPLALCLLAACTGDIATPTLPDSSTSATSTPQRCSMTPQGCGGFAAPRIRRLTRSEYDATTQSLLGSTLALGGTLPAELRQSGFTRNDAQVVDTVFAAAAEQAAIALADDAVTHRLSVLAPCVAGADGAACAQHFIDTFAAQAFRRPLTADDRAGLLSVYQAAAVLDGGYTTGIRWLMRAVLQAPSFLYLTELGTEADPGTLDDDEIASELSYLLTGAPPDSALQQAAAAHTLRDAATRQAHARRLIAAALARGQLSTFVVQWLGLDRLDSLSKDNALFPDFASLKPHYLDEARAFTTEVFFTRHGGLTQLLGADFTVASPEVAQAYGLQGSGVLSLATTTRRGILNQGAFLSAYSNVADSGPIHRGAAVVRKVMCQHLPDPSELKIMVMPPPPDPTLSTRERFSAHSVNPDCHSCHKLIDPAGFAFEGFGTDGRARAEDNGKTVDSSGELTLGDVTGPFSNGEELIAKLSHSTGVSACFATNLYRYALAQSNAAGEAAFADRTLDLNEAQRSDPLELLVALAGSDLFIERRAP